MDQPPKRSVAKGANASTSVGAVVTQHERPDTFVVVCVGDEVWVAQGAVMGTAKRPHMQNRTYSHYTPLFRTQSRDDLNDAYSIAQTLVVWLNLGVVAWVEAQKVPLVPTSQAEPLPAEQPDPSLATPTAQRATLATDVRDGHYDEMDFHL